MNERRKCFHYTNLRPALGSVILLSGSRPFNLQVSINEAIQGREERVLAIKHDGADAPYLVKCVRPHRQAAGTSEAASNWGDNTASQNMFLNIFFLHPTMQRGAFAELMGFPCFLCPPVWPLRA